MELLEDGSLPDGDFVGGSMTEVEVVGLIFGARGAVPVVTRRTLARLGLPMGSLRPLQLEIVANSLFAFQAFLRRCEGAPVH